MSSQQPAEGPEDGVDPRVIIIDPQGQQTVRSNEQSADDGEEVTELVEEPAKVMRIGSMIRMLLEEVKAVVDTTLPLDRASEAHALMESGEHSGKILLRT